ncbi:sulfate transporter [Photobacterium sanguinicancri]|uniref:Sulfate transporter n=2 Tax=Photobacterium sanguinicancri TaxID=875932 RepID=A0ABX4G3B1_9GAMM|nr:sulfate transporter [Photobacterium sanguinicancri]
MLDSKQRLVPISTVDDYDIEINDFVEKHISEARNIQQTLKTFKRKVYEDCYAFLELLAEKYETKKKRGGAKGGFSFSSYDGALQIKITVQDRITFGPELQIAKELIDECVQDWSSDANDYLKVLINDAFEVDREGNLNTGRILSLRKHKDKIIDQRWMNAMEAIADAIMVTGSKTYLNFRERTSEGKLINIPLDLAAL